MKKESCRLTQMERVLGGGKGFGEGFFEGGGFGGEEVGGLGEAVQH